MTYNRSLGLLALMLCVCLQSCLPDKPGIYQNAKIPSGIQNKLHKLNDNLLAALKANSVNDADHLLSREMINSGYKRLRTVEKASLAMKNEEYSLLADYYVVNKLKATGADTIKERNMGENNFDFLVQKDVQYNYVAMFASKSPQSKLITATYNKLNYGWKIVDLEFEPYRENGKTSPELLQHAKQLVKDGRYLDAVNACDFAANTLRPAGAFVFVKDKAIADYCVEVLGLVRSRYHLPLIIKNIPTQPKIWRLAIERNKEGAYPNINYISKINLLDTMALRKENALVSKAIGGVFKGIDQDKKYIYYTIYDETAKGVPYRDHYDLRQELNK